MLSCFFVKQKTAYELRISDWSSDVCSSDLSAPSIRSTIGKEKAPAPDVLPIIKSEDVAADPQKAADNYRELLKLKPDVDTRDESTRRLADLQVQMADSSGASPDSEKAVRESISLYKGLLKEHPDDPKNARIYYQLARAQQKIGRAHV